LIVCFTFSKNWKRVFLNLQNSSKLETYLQKAMKEQHIDLKEVEKDMLGSAEEHRAPPPKNS
jgi:hypothetical protein